MKTSTPTPTPRPALKATGMRRRHARCLETELTTLTAERDRLRAELEKVYLLVTPVGFDLPGGIFETAQAVTELRAERDQLRDEVERVNALGSWAHTCIHHNDKQRTECSVCLVTTLTAERDQLRAELSDQAARFHDEIVSRQGTVRANQELDLKELNHFRAELAAEREKVTMLLSDAYALTKNWHDRAERAEAELATERARTKQIATALTDAISTYFGADKLVTAERIEAWQYALKEGAK